MSRTKGSKSFGSGIYPHKPHQLFKKGHLGYWKNKKFSKKHKENLSIAHKEPTKKTRKKMNDVRKGKYSGSNHPRWKGGRFKRKDGYIDIWIPQHPFARVNYVFEHRLVVEKQIGRYLEEKERVHHINGIRDDNHPQNLMAFINMSAHIKFEAIQEGMKKGEIVFDGRLFHS